MRRRQEIKGVRECLAENGGLAPADKHGAPKNLRRLERFMFIAAVPFMMLVQFVCRGPVGDHVNFDLAGMNRLSVPFTEGRRSVQARCSGFSLFSGGNIGFQGGLCQLKNQYFLTKNSVGMLPTLRLVLSCLRRVGLRPGSRWVPWLEQAGFKVLQ